MKGWDGLRTLWRKLDRAKYPLVLLLVGALLLAWPGGERESSAPAVDAQPDPFGVEELEDRLEEILSGIRGAGQVRVALSLAQSPRRILAQDGRVDGAGGAKETSTVVLSRGGGTQEGLELARTGPVWQGAVVVAQGGDDPLVRLSLSEAVSALTGLGTDKISICKGK